MVLFLGLPAVIPAAPGSARLPNRVASGLPVASVPSDTIIWETIGNPENLDPHVNYNTYGAWVLFNVYETLFTYPWSSADTTPNVPLLAESLVVSADGLNYTFALRQGIEFQDGTPFNASCVKYNFERVMAIFDSFGPAWMFAERILGGQAVEDAVYAYGEGSPQHVSNYTAWKAANDAGTGAIIVLSTYVVRLRLAYQYSPFLAAITYEVGAMMSPTWVEANGGIAIGAHNDYVDTHTCGTGPYIVTEWSPDSYVQLELNPSYWRATDAKTAQPYAGNCTSITIKTNNDADSRILNLKAGISDGAYWPVSRSEEIWNHVNGTSGNGTLKSKYSYLKIWCHELTYSVVFLGFNMKPYLRRLSAETVLNPFAMKTLRESLSYAFNYTSYIEQALNGFGVQAQGPIPIGMFCHNDSLPVYEYDPQRAVQKWNDAMAEGLESILANMSYRIDLYYGGSEKAVLPYMLMRDCIDAILADPNATQPSQPLIVDVVSLDWPTYQYLYSQKQLPIYVWGWIPDYADPDNYVNPFVMSTSWYPTKIGLGDSDGWNSTLVDGWISAAVKELDPSTRQEFYDLIQDAIVEHCAYIWAYQAQSFHVENARMNGYVFNAMHEPYLYSYWKDEVTAPVDFDSWNSLGSAIIFASLAAIVVFGSAIIRSRWLRRSEYLDRKDEVVV